MIGTLKIYIIYMWFYIIITDTFVCIISTVSLQVMVVQIEYRS